jgi:hypothetical protein
MWFLPFCTLAIRGLTAAGKSELTLILGFGYTDTLILDGTLGITKLKVNVFNANNTPTSAKKKRLHFNSIW